jgi:hypothetical protein
MYQSKTGSHLIFITCTTDGPKLKRQAKHFLPSFELMNLEFEIPERNNSSSPELSRIRGFNFSIDPFWFHTSFTEATCRKESI